MSDNAPEVALTVEQTIQALPPDAIARVVQAYRDAYERAYTDSHAAGWDKQQAAGCAAFRDALAAVLPRVEPAPLSAAPPAALREAPPVIALVNFFRHARKYPEQHRMSVLDDYTPDPRTLAWVLDTIIGFERGETGNRVERFQRALAHQEEP